MALRQKFVNLLYAINEDFGVYLTANYAYVKSFGRLPRLNGKKFSERIFARKVRERNPLYSTLADKVLVKDYVAREIGAQYVIPTLWAGPDISKAPLTTLPKPYVIKANHGSGWNIFVRNDAELDIDKIKRSCAAWTSRVYGRRYGEWLYGSIRPQILIEPYITGLAELPLDYKFFVFGGKAELIQVDTGREKDHKRRFFDRDWNPKDFVLCYPLETAPIAQPPSLVEMTRAAEKLAAPFEFARVDFYEIEGKPLFGELTFYPGSGTERFTPESWDDVMGQYWPAPARR